MTFVDALLGSLPAEFEAEIRLAGGACGLALVLRVRSMTVDLVRLPLIPKRTVAVVRVSDVGPRGETPYPSLPLPELTSHLRAAARRMRIPLARERPIGAGGGGTETGWLWLPHHGGGGT